ncbi:hypothetical protein [Streptomyces sp. NBC_00557]|uniref:hypothetical protein n=1 Tax=Streptomyces sp. NBC_00557 TaxID=2975776 RepID=UPI002E81A375|nr:hypothetical protein [Streptomyces sp. NBC_00557]WUC36382.1 hypothetical protein OG956_20235 [Streptomyces sp. NBC_00557]
MVNTDRTPETFEEIAARTGRPLSTVRNTWSRHPAWPAPLEERRGRWRQFDPDAVDAFLRAHIDRTAAVLEPERLYTATELEAAGIGLKASTIRADLSRSRSGGPRRWPEPDDTTGGVNRWTGRTVAQALEGRRGYRRTNTGDS